MTLDQHGPLVPDDLDDVADRMADLVSGGAEKAAGQGGHTPWPACAPVELPGIETVSKFC
jgi:hypothetical protein